jgi:hypothetical protein
MPQAPLAQPAFDSRQPPGPTYTESPSMIGSVRSGAAGAPSARNPAPGTYHATVHTCTLHMQRQNGRCASPHVHGNAVSFVRFASSHARGLPLALAPGLLVALLPELLLPLPPPPPLVPPLGIPPERTRACRTIRQAPFALTQGAQLALARGLVPAQLSLTASAPVRHESRSRVASTSSPRLPNASVTRAGE